MRRCYVLTACGVLCLLAGCGGGDPFSYVKVSGKVTYDDGSRIAAPEIKLTFYPLAPPADSKTYPRPGAAVVNVATGEFSSVTSHSPGDGLVRGKHKVTLCGPRHQALPEDLVPAEYFNRDKTPLEVDTDHWLGVLKVHKPK